MKKVSYLNAVRDGIAEEMRKDPTIFMIGEGISERGGSYAQTKDLWAEFGDERIVDAPISENGWAALSVGAAQPLVSQHLRVLRGAGVVVALMRRRPVP